MRKATVAATIVLLSLGTLIGAQADDENARAIVIQALSLPNDLGVGGREFRTKANPRGQGVFVYDPRTTFKGAQRFLIWVVVNDQAYPLNGPSKTLTPSLRWPRDAGAAWGPTGLDPDNATEAITILFGTK